MRRDSSPPFIELLAKTCGSFLEGASYPEEMLARAAQLGYPVLGIADRDGVYGLPRAHTAAHEKGVRLVCGAELRVTGGEAVLLARDRGGYGNLCELLTLSHGGLAPDAAPEGEPVELSWELIVDKSPGLFLVLPPLWDRAVPFDALREAFAGRLYLAASRFHDGRGRQADAASALSRRHSIPCLATNRPLFHDPTRKRLQDVMSCIRHGCSLDEAGFRLLPNAERHLKSPDRMAELFHDEPGWLESTLAVAGECSFSLSELSYRYPTEWIPAGETSDGYLERLVGDGARTRYPGGVPDGVARQIRRELELVRELKYADYFLTIHDIVQFARREGILCQGRGSAANSVLCFVLGITAVDPVRMDLLFERFISREREEPPDIDIDFEHERREEVIQYIYSRYGRHRAAITAEVICYRRKSALRETAKAFGVPDDAVRDIQTLTHRRSLDEVDDDELIPALPGLDPKQARLWLATAREIRGFPRHLGTHVGGFVLCQEPLNRTIPIQATAMPGRGIVQWDKNDLDALGFVRVDVLGLGILTCLRKCMDYVRETHGRELTLASIPAEDPLVYDQLCAADTVGIFQIESRAQMNMLPRLRPRTFHDLVVELSLVRPGPIQGEMVHPYLRRRSGREKIEYPHPALEQILGKTCGVPLFQEQIMKIAMAVAGFTGGEADALRRAMGAWRRNGNLSAMGERFRSGLTQHGISPEFADRIFRQIEGFAEYGFPESHAASFALLAYASAWLRHYYPDAYLAGILNAQPMGFYATHTLVADATRHGVTVLPVDANLSGWDNRLEAPGRVRLGLREIHGLGKRVADALETARATGPFTCFAELVERVRAALPGLMRRDLFRLASAHAFESLGLSRREAFWEIQGLPLPADPALAAGDVCCELPAETGWERISGDTQAQGVCLSEHPMAYLRAETDLSRLTPSRELPRLPPKRRVAVGGLVISRQMPENASGVLFITIEDEHGFTNLVIWARVFEKFRVPLLTESLLECHGRIERAEDGNVTHVIVETAAPLVAGASICDASRFFH